MSTKKHNFIVAQQAASQHAQAREQHYYLGSNKQYISKQFSYGVKNPGRSRERT